MNTASKTSLAEDVAIAVDKLDRERKSAQKYIGLAMYSNDCAPRIAEAEMLLSKALAAWRNPGLAAQKSLGDEILGARAAE